MNLEISEPLFWLYLINLSFVLLVLLHILYQRRSPQNLMAWLLTLILLPLLGVMLYLIFGSRKFLNKHNKSKINMHTQAFSPVQPKSHLAIQLDQILRSNHIAGTTCDNQVKAFEDNHDALHALLKAINGAQSHIHFETYILELDETGQTILEALIQKAQQGVEVRLLMDAIGSLTLYLNPKKLKPLEQAGGRYAFFQPIWPSLLKSQINLRNHRKIFLIDQHTLFTGGMNLSKEYLGTTEKLDKHTSWVDLLFKIQGSITLHYQHVFNEDWRYTTHETLAKPVLTEASPKLDTQPNGELMQAVPSGPDIDNDALFETILHSIYYAKTHIQIATPYFIPDSSIMNALLIALKRGVKVTLVSPKTSDHIIFDLGRSSYMRELHEAGGEIYLFTPSMLHAKLIIIDDEVTLVGSANFDYRSLFINHEMVNFIYSHKLIKTLSNWLNQKRLQSEPYQPNNQRLSNLFENLTRIFTPLL